MYNEEKIQHKTPYRIPLVRRSIDTHYETLLINNEDFIREVLLSYRNKDLSCVHRKQSGFNIIRMCNNHVIIKFEHISFEVKDLNLIQVITSGCVINDKAKDEENKTIYFDATFSNCKFETPLYINDAIESNILFENCIFTRDVKLKGPIAEGLKFYKSTFYGHFDLENTLIKSTLDITETLFSETSYVRLNNAKMDFPGKFFIRDTQFVGKFEATNLELSSYSNFMNISFFNILDISNIKFSGTCFLDNISFAKSTTPQMLDAQRELAKSLEKWGLKKEIKNLGLIVQTQNSKEISEKYEIAIRTGWLKPSFAALFLGKSVSYLTQKRKKDKEMITRDSIPFTGVGKNIQYPVDALLAYKAKDWDKLKELRQKYKNKED